MIFFIVKIVWLAANSGNEARHRVVVDYASVPPSGHMPYDPWQESALTFVTMVSIVVIIVVIIAWLV